MLTENTTATVWLLWCASLVLLARIGLGLIHVGLSRPRHSIGLSIQHLIVLAVSAFAYWSIGFSLMFGFKGNELYGWGLAFINTDLIRTESGTGPLIGAFFLLQMMIATLPCMIIVGATGERLKPIAAVIITLWIGSVVYPLFGHWATPDLLNLMEILKLENNIEGWLYQVGFFDYGGAATVHVLGGWAALAVLLVIKPRVGHESDNPGRFLENIHHAMPMTFLGVFLFALGLLGLAGLKFEDGRPTLSAAGTTARNVMLALSTGSLLPYVLIGFWQKQMPASLMIKSAMGALIATLAGITVIGPYGAIIIAIFGALAAMLFDRILQIFGVDDNTGSVAIHLGGGITGTLACSFVLAHSNLENPGLELGFAYFQNQFKGLVICFFFAFPTTWLLAHILKRLDLLRYSKDIEIGGLDRRIFGQKLPSDQLIEQIDQQRRNPVESFELDIEYGTQIGAVAQAVNQILKDERGRIHDFETMLNQSQEGMLSVNLANYQILWSNPAACEMLETSDEMLKSEQLQDFFSHTDDPLRPLLPRKGVQSWQLKKRDHQTIDVDVIATEVTTTQGQRLHIFFQDATERRDVQAMLELAKQAAEEASKSKSEFLANISHEIRTPMNGIIGMTEMALQTDLDEEQQEYLATVKESSDHLLSLMNDVLDYAKIEAGKIDIESVPYAPIDITRKTIKGLSVKAKEKNLDLNVVIDPDVPLTVIGDPTRFRQVLINLVDNAIKFTRDGSVSVILSIKPLTQFAIYLHVSVIDTGVGIPMEKQTRIFSAFEQADSSITRKHGGTGLGLSICNRLVELMNGRIWLESEIDKGTTFYVDIRVGLPLNDDTGEFEAITEADIGKKPDNQQTVEVVVKSYDLKESKASASRGSADNIQKNGKRILVVDDKQINRKVLEKMLAHSPHPMTFADSGEKAVALCGQMQFDLVLMDLQMPGMDGYQATKQIHSLDKELKRPLTHIVALTAHSGEDYRLACESAGMRDYLLKPVDRDKLNNVIEAAPHRTQPSAAKTEEMEIELATEIETPLSETVNQPPMVKAHINKVALKQRLGDAYEDKTLLQDLAKLLAEDGEKAIARLNLSDLDQTLAALHTIKGMSANVGAELISELAATWHQKLAAEMKSKALENGDDFKNEFPSETDWRKLLSASVDELSALPA